MRLPTWLSCLTTKISLSTLQLLSGTWVTSGVGRHWETQSRPRPILQHLPSSNVAYTGSPMPSEEPHALLPTLLGLPCVYLLIGWFPQALDMLAVPLSSTSSFLLLCLSPFTFSKDCLWEGEATDLPHDLPIQRPYDAVREADAILEVAAILKIAHLDPFQLILAVFMIQEAFLPEGEAKEVGSGKPSLGEDEPTFLTSPVNITTSRLSLGYHAYLCHAAQQ